MINGCSLCQICVESEVSAKPTSNGRMTTANAKNSRRRSEKTMGNDTATRHTNGGTDAKTFGIQFMRLQFDVSDVDKYLVVRWGPQRQEKKEEKNNRRSIVGEDAKHKARTSHTKRKCVYSRTHSNPVECTRHRINEMAVNVDD